MTLLVIPVLAQALTLSAGDRSELRLRYDSGRQFFDAQTLAYVQLQLSSPRVQWGLQYSPAYTSFAVGTVEHASTLDNTGTLRCNLRLAPRTSISIAESMSYGERNMRLSALSAPAPTASATTDPSNASGGVGAGTSANGAAAQPLVGPAASSVRYASNSASATLTHQVDPRLGISGAISYMLAQGLDLASRQRIPRAEVMLASISASEQVARADAVVLTLSGQKTSTRLEGSPTPVEDPNGQSPIRSTAASTQSVELNAWIAIGALGWSHRFSRYWSSTANATAAYTMSTGADGRRKLGVIPGGMAAVQYSSFLRGGRLSVAWSESFAPTVDRYSGTVVSRLSSSVFAAWTRRALSFGASGSWVTAVGSQDASQTLLGSISMSEFVGYQLSRHWRGELGFRELWQSYQGRERTPMIWNVYLAVSYGTGPIPL